MSGGGGGGGVLRFMGRVLQLKAGGLVPSAMHESMTVKRGLYVASGSDVDRRCALHVYCCFTWEIES